MSKEKNPLTVEIVQRVFPEARETYGRNGSEFVVHCPFPHQKGGRYKLYINEGGAFHCQDCSRSGDAWASFFDGIVSRRYGHLHLVRDRTEPQGQHRSGFIASQGKSQRWADGKILAPGRTIPLHDLPRGHPAYEYLEVHRGMDPDEFASEDHPFAALYCAEGQFELMNGELKTEGRIVFPVMQGGEPVGWTARRIERDLVQGETKEVWDGKKWNLIEKSGEGGRWGDHHIPKWFHLPSMRKSTLLYNLDSASEFDTVVISEGVFDVHKIGPFSVAYFGEVPSGHQIRILKNRFETVVWVPDSGVDMKKRSIEDAMKSIMESCRLIVRKLPGREDPGQKEVTRSEIKKFLRESLNL